ncbi:MAG: hypothetical protein J3R72DRAFT_460844 [Linnemannia gamsii]|nr:MAG: hypothetical protein J3R72DRAFT_460844 [Linnemannia gamsii]
MNMKKTLSNLLSSADSWSRSPYDTDKSSHSRQPVSEMTTTSRPGTQSGPVPPSRPVNCIAGPNPHMPSDYPGVAKSQNVGIAREESLYDHSTSGYPATQRNNYQTASAYPAAQTSSLHPESMSDYPLKNGNDSFPQETNIVFVGNPGVGKSALLNVFGGSFESGCSEVAGLTRQVTKVPVTLSGRPLFLFDVPGIDDCIEEGGEDTIVKHLQMLQEALNGGGHFVIFFVITPRNGRIEPSDYMMMKTVLDSLKKAPMVGLILTQVKPKHIDQVRSKEYTLKLLAPLEKIVESKEFIPRRYPLVLLDHGDGKFSEEEKVNVMNYVFSFEPKPVISRNMVDQVVRRFFEMAKMGFA